MPSVSTPNPIISCTGDLSSSTSLLRASPFSSLPYHLKRSSASDSVNTTPPTELPSLDLKTISLTRVLSFYRLAPLALGIFPRPSSYLQLLLIHPPTPMSSPKRFFVLLAIPPLTSHPGFCAPRTVIAGLQNAVPQPKRKGLCPV